MSHQLPVWIAVVFFAAFVVYFHNEYRASFLFLSTDGSLDTMKLLRYAFVLSLGVAALAYWSMHCRKPTAFFLTYFGIIALFMTLKRKEDKHYNRMRSLVEGALWASIWIVTAVAAEIHRGY